MISLTKDKRMLGYASLDVYSDIFHFVTTRIGGCSEGTYATFNCSPFAGDERVCVRRNQEILFEAMPEKPRELIIPHQTHGTKSLVVDETFLTLSEEDRCTRLEGIDALITREEGCCICVSTADCVPVLLYDRQHQVVAAVHAGWRGTVNFTLVIHWNRCGRFMERKVRRLWLVSVLAFRWNPLKSVMRYMIPSV